ncbi:hypothetical protein CCACVL1_02994 [Corchorus capsularis]|uniref:Uncharacterized protein n=1 Tax=Corchorus capsularis TaxID=210143 RepID=A0A1R3K410_COCAP|nr:hypothetical protein CCACVL1_02994 [Corchorus capsularis]
MVNGALVASIIVKPTLLDRI